MKDILERRARILKEIRKFFDDRSFVEVETPVRIAAPAPEEYIDCPVVLGKPPSAAAGGAKEGYTYLRASPELQMKKLLAGGMDLIYQIGPCFREGEKGDRHNPEFTMIEWYRRHASYLDIKADLESLFSQLTALSADGSCRLFQDLRVRDAYRKHAGWDPWLAWDRDRFDFDMSAKIEPAIRELGGGVFLMDYPPEAASLAVVSDGSAERWEFYWNGMELANCFSELCDRDEQLARFEKAKEFRKLLNESDYPIDYEFIDSVPAMERAAGVALGVDRLIMVLTDVSDISAVRVMK